MTKHTFSVEPRTIVGRKVKQLRKTGLVPAGIFGKTITSQNIQLKSKDFLKLIKTIGESSLIYLQVKGDNTEKPVLVRELTSDPVSGELLHVSFNQVSLKEKVAATVSIEITGESPAERDKLGILVQQLDQVDIEALPTDIPEGFTVDATILAEVNSTITVGDLVVDKSKITITTDSESIIAKIEPLAAEEVVEEAPAADAETTSTSEATSEASTETPESSS